MIEPIIINIIRMYSSAYELQTTIKVNVYILKTAYYYNTNSQSSHFIKIGTFIIPHELNIVFFCHRFSEQAFKNGRVEKKNYTYTDNVFCINLFVVYIYF